jgi:hypothetical protein
MPSGCISLNFASVTFSNAFWTAPPKAALAPVSGADTPKVIDPSRIAGHFFVAAPVVVAPAVVALAAAAVVAAAEVAAAEVAAAEVAAAEVAELLLPLLSLPQAAASRALAPRTAPSTRRE